MEQPNRLAQVTRAKVTTDLVIHHYYTDPGGRVGVGRVGVSWKNGSRNLQQILRSEAFNITKHRGGK